MSETLLQVEKSADRISNTFRGVVKAVEEKLGASLYICEEPEIVGALGSRSLRPGRSSEKRLNLSL